MLEKSTMGIIFPNMHDSLIPALTGHRTMASVPFAGRYRMIDFNLSAMANAGIETIGIIVKQNYQSLMDHLGNGREWDLSRKRGGLTIFPPYGGGGGKIYHGRIEALYNIKDYLTYQKEELVVLADCDIACNLDFDDIIEQHVNNKADVTVVYKKEPMNEGIAKSNTTVTLDGCRITEMLINDYRSGMRNISLDVFVINRQLLIEIVKDAYMRGYTMFESDVLARSLKAMNVCGYEYTGYSSRIYDMKSFYDANMSLLNHENMKALFGTAPVYTKIRDEAPVRYALDCKVVNSMVADGCIIDGEVENCVLFRGVKVGKGAKIKNCVVMQGTIVDADATMEYVITDKNVEISSGQTLNGTANYPVFISKGGKV